LKASDAYSDLAEWTGRLSQGDHEAFRLLYAFFYSDLYRYVLRIVKSEAIAEDIIHDTFVKVWETRQTLDKNLSIKSYLFTSCRNRALNVLEKAANDHRLEGEILYHYAFLYNNTAQDQEYLESRLAQLHEALELLPPTRKEVYKMAKLQGLSYEAIAQKLTISKGTVSDHVVKANRFLTLFLKKDIR
jgi:RNA polymerase sigma-70 factor (ECF subfamily)